MPSLLRELKRQKFKGWLVIEYEYRVGDLMGAIKKSIENFNRMVEEMH